jgi:hypothetical protein
MDLPTLQTFKREESKTQVTASNPKEQSTSFPFAWLLFKPQNGAVEPFKCNEPSRLVNTR